MHRLSVVIITYNEELNIERCLDSVEHVADEIIVVDSFSVDKTPEICRARGVTFIQNPFDGYIEQKNYAVNQATYPLVLALDADEALSPALQRSVIKVKSQQNYDGYFCNRRNNYYGKWMRYTSRFPDRKLRLWDRTKGKWGGSNPHDMVVMEKGARTAIMDGELYHYPYSTISEHIAQINRFTDIAADSYYKNHIRADYLKIIVHPAWKFFREYFIRRGFLDGFHGLVVSGSASFETFLKYVKLRQLYRKKSEPDN
jgi:glycosyltransferase involved in cell wall biosynthesis